jgi:hypothetical protein
MKKTMAKLLLATYAALAGAQEPERPPGHRVELIHGELFVPQGYEVGPEGVHLVLHLHGAAWAAERNLVRSGERAVLVTVVLHGLSAVYAELFGKPETFPRVLNEVQRKLRELDVANEPQIGRLTVTSFSAGFGGVRELLKSQEAYDRIDALVMADSIHAGFVGAPEERRVSPEHVQPFVRFAKDAAEGRKTLVISHSAIEPPTYASTTETADYIINGVGGERTAVDRQWAEGLRCTSQYQRGSLSIYGFAGDTGPDHMRHLHELWRLMERARRGEGGSR